MLPILVQERVVRRFFFYNDGRLYEGMSYQNKLYQLIENFSVDDRPSAYLLACKFSRDGRYTVITASSRRYQVWVNLQAADSSVERHCELSHSLD
jgi:hypothetical protein